MTEKQRRAMRAEYEALVRRVFIPLEARGQLRTQDGTAYRRQAKGQIVRVWPKVRGKKARAADRFARRLTRQQEAAA